MDFHVFDAGEGQRIGCSDYAMDRSKNVTAAAFTPGWCEYTTVNSEARPGSRALSTFVT
jgi:hypothetical protein